MDEEVEQTMKALQHNRFDVRSAETAEAAKRIVLDIIPQEAVVGIGDSATVRQIGVLPELERRGTRVINPFKTEIHKNTELLQQMTREALRSDVFLTSSNTVTLDGKLVNTDMVGNRVAGMIYGAKKVVLVVGKNKIVKDVEEALYRLRHLITPYHAARKKRKVPCAISGECNDCNTIERVCNVTTIIEKKPYWTDLTIVFIDEDLGLAWSPSWTQERINQVKAKYEEVTEPIILLD